MSVEKIVLVIGCAALLGSMTSALNSPCPDLFHYDSTDQPGEWTGTVTLMSDVDLHGVWIRLMFDRKLTELHVSDQFGQVVPKDNNHHDYLVKNRNFLLKSAVPVSFKITVKYEGSEIPMLTGYRLNANLICSSENELHNYFEGDLNSHDYDFLKSVQSDEKDYNDFEGCGTVPLSLDKEVKNGKAKNGQWPWQAVIYIQKNNDPMYVCEATLISPEHVLTAAHCVAYVKTKLAVPSHRVIIYLGTHNNEESNTIQKFTARKIVLHPAYRSSNLLNDLAIIRLDKPVVVNDYVRPICLRTSSDNKEGFLVGYGINADNKIEDLAQAQVKIIRDQDCAKQHSNLRNFLTDNVLCAKYVQDPPLCVGDSGSGMISLREGPSEGQKDIWKLKGVVTVGVPLQHKSKCDLSSVILLANVNNYVKWIQSIIS